MAVGGLMTCNCDYSRGSEYIPHFSTCVTFNTGLTMTSVEDMEG